MLRYGTQWALHKSGYEMIDGRGEDDGTLGGTPTESVRTHGDGAEAPVKSDWFYK